MNQRLNWIAPSVLACVICMLTTAATAQDSPQDSPTAAEVLRIKWVNPPPQSPEGVQHGTFESTCMDTAIGYNIYLPAAYDARPQARFPVVYFLHGSAGNESRSIRLATTLQAAIEAGDVPPMLMVFANGGRNSGYIDTVDGTVRPETMITKELIPHIDATYRTIDQREGRAIQGFSMGGGGSLRIAAKHPDLFSSVVVYGAGGVREFKAMPTVEELANVKRAAQKLRTKKILMGEDLQYWRDSGSWYLLEQNRDRIAGRLPIRIVIGTNDYSLAGAKVARDRLEELKIAFEFELVQGVDHNIYKLYDHAGVKGLQFHARHFIRTASE